MRDKHTPFPIHMKVLQQQVWTLVQPSTNKNQNEYLEPVLTAGAEIQLQIMVFPNLDAFKFEKQLLKQQKTQNKCGNRI